MASTTVKMAGSECACEDSAEAQKSKNPLGIREVKAQEEQRRGERKCASSKLKIQEFAEEKEDRDRQPLDLIQKSRQPSDRTGAARGLPSGKAKVKSRKEG
jgi:hypothetical protein